MDLQRKIDFAINLLRNIPQDGPIEICYSGGKDSDVILDLAKWAGIPYDAIYKNTTIDVCLMRDCPYRQEHRPKYEKHKNEPKLFEI